MTIVSVVSGVTLHSRPQILERVDVLERSVADVHLAQQSLRSTPLCSLHSSIGQRASSWALRHTTITPCLNISSMCVWHCLIMLLLVNTDNKKYKKCLNPCQLQKHCSVIGLIYKFARPTDLKLLVMLTRLFDGKRVWIACLFMASTDIPHRN